MLLNRGVEAALKVVEGDTLSTRKMRVTFKRCLGECPPRGRKCFFLSGNLGRRLEIFCKICNVTIAKITKQIHT